jgi:hypothetical protein
MQSSQRMRLPITSPEPMLMQFHREGQDALRHGGVFTCFQRRVLGGTEGVGVGLHPLEGRRQPRWDSGRVAHGRRGTAARRRRGFHCARYRCCSCRRCCCWQWWPWFDFSHALVCHGELD